MSYEDVSNKTKLSSYDAPEIAVQRPLKKKKSLTRLFITSRSSSRSRAPSVNEKDIPTTPNIPEQYLSSPRKASNCESPPVTTHGNFQSVQPGLKNVTNTAVVSDSRSDARIHSFRGILKPRPEIAQAQRNVPDCAGTVSPTSQSTTRSPTSSISYKPNNERSTVQSPSIIPQVRKNSDASIRTANVSSPRHCTRVASAASLRTKNLKAIDHIPQRPSTSGGERFWTGRDTDSVMEDFHGIGSNLAPSPTTDQDIRASFRSAMTTASSIPEPSTTRSSVLTKESDTTVESPRRNPEDEGMTVDEAIGMYENGFIDDDSDHDVRSGSSINEEEQRRSKRIAEAINDTIGPLTQNSGLGPSSSSLELAVESATILPGFAPRKVAPRVPAIMPPTVTRDQYGFLKGSRYINVTHFDTWEKAYAPDQFRRSKKWFTYMREQGCATHFPDQFPDRSPKTLRYVRKGIPPAWRGAAWFYYSGGANLLQENPRTYSSLLSRCKASELSSNDIEAIERDLHRTFPDNIHFKPDQPANHASETPLLSSLRRLLQAFAIYRPQIGYCQSLNFLAGLLLLFLPEEKAFWMLHIITTEHLPGTHEISLEGANVDLWVLMLALKESNPSIWAKVGVGDEEAGSVHTARLPPISFCTTSWFMSMFIGTLPIESVLRVWDVVFYEGSKMLFRIALAIFKVGEQRIKEVNDSMELFQVVQTLPRGMLDIGLLLAISCRRGGISQEWIGKKRKDRRAWSAKERARVAGAMTLIDGGDGPIASGTPNLSQVSSTWRRRVGRVK